MINSELQPTVAAEVVIEIGGAHRVLRHCLLAFKALDINPFIPSELVEFFRGLDAYRAAEWVRAGTLHEHSAGGRRVGQQVPSIGEVMDALDSLSATELIGRTLEACGLKKGADEEDESRAETTSGGLSWLSVWAIGCSPDDLGLTEERFWLQTPAMFMALMERKRVASEREFYPFACLLAQSCNLAPFVKRSRLMAPSDYMPNRPKRGNADSKRGLGPEVFAAFQRAADEHAAWAAGK